ncbi:type VII secretion protein EccB [Agromyces protaetiae]|uniref:Type VII secretion protein EccB n=1 Tax=Agromyces protaetiae TaxID=2509455 RepID=A0A4P6F8I1_9MICO|nr:type VII secretion protein EccB [Agromyces protaetiae]QAY72142.1 type VII secretion protein EccB [Agromyces protaetiae]
MATKKDLIEAQGFSRRRLLTAFTGGAPGGKELEPAKPLRAVIAGIALTVMLLLGGLFYGLIRPGLPADWENDRLIIATDTGARYISVEGILHPVINTASARLLVPSGTFSVISTDQGSLEGIEIGRSVGIVGAPDDLPSSAALIDDGWSACLPGGGKTVVALSAKPLSKRAGAGTGLVVRRGEDLFVVAGSRRYSVAAGQSSAILRAVGLGESGAVEVDGRWLDLFSPGAPLAPLEVAGAGDPVDGTSLSIGQVVHQIGAAADERYLVTEAGELAPISSLAYQLYLLGTGAVLGAEEEVSPADTEPLPNSDSPAGSADWPDAALRGLGADVTPCARLDTSGDEPKAVLGSTETELPAPSAGGTVAMEVGKGAVVLATGAGANSAGTHFVIDATGTAYAVPGGDLEPLKRLGYDEADVTRVPSAWIAFFPSGPTLSPGAAGATHDVEAQG